MLTKFQFQLSSNQNHCPLTVNVIGDGTVIARHSEFDGTQIVVWELPDHDLEIQQQHCLKIQLQGKTDDHTDVDGDQRIVRDVLISIDNIYFDDTRIDQIFYAQAVYEHDYNGNGNAVKDRFFGHMGCNGTVTFDFYSPAYQWLLENL